MQLTFCKLGVVDFPEVKQTISICYHSLVDIQLCLAETNTCKCSRCCCPSQSEWCCETAHKVLFTRSQCPVATVTHRRRRRGNDPLFYSCTWWDCAESHVLDKSHGRRTSWSRWTQPGSSLVLCGLLLVLLASERFAVVLISKRTHGLWIAAERLLKRKE